MLFFLFALSTIGMTHIIVDGNIMAWFREAFQSLAKKTPFPHIGDVVSCYLCCGFWCGLLMGWAWISHDFLHVFGCGCAGAFLANSAAILLNLMEAMTIVRLSEDEK